MTTTQPAELPALSDVERFDPLRCAAMQREAAELYAAARAALAS